VPDLAPRYVLTSDDWNRAAADAEFQHALALDPDHADVLRALANHAVAVRRQDEVVALARRAVAVDPLSVVARRQYGRHCAAAGRLAEAVVALRATIDLNPQAGLTHSTLSCTRLPQGSPGAALAGARAEGGAGLKNGKHGALDGLTPE
jgi:tetratricopeptide (TPR) repeat protein